MFVMFCEFGGSPVKSIIIRKCGYIVRLSIIYSYKNRARVVEHCRAVSEVMTTTYSFRLRLKYYCVNTHFSPLYHSSKPCQACRCNIQTGLNTL